MAAAVPTLLWCSLAAPPAPSAICPSAPRPAPSPGGTHTSRPVDALCLCVPAAVVRTPESGGLLGRGGKDGSRDGEAASQGETPSPLLQESPVEPRGARGRRGLRSAPRRREARAELVQLQLVKDKKSRVGRSEAVKAIGDSKALFPEIVARAAEQLRCVFGFERKQLDCEHPASILINKPKPLDEEDLGGGGPRSGRLMMVLGLIDRKGNRARGQLWKMLRRLGVRPSKFLFGYPKRLIMEDFVQQRSIPQFQAGGSHHPREYEFSWGPRSNLETSKMKVMGFVAKLRKKEPQHWPVQDREALAGLCSGEGRWKSGQRGPWVWDRPPESEQKRGRESLFL
ncbi:LOW QUALITY PROTEIN: melanoma-associated antigen F1 [Trichechus inunguis]